MHTIFLVADTTLHLAVSVGRSVRPSVTFLNFELFSHYCSCPAVHDWIAVYPALFISILCLSLGHKDEFAWSLHIFISFVHLFIDSFIHSYIHIHLFFHYIIYLFMYTFIHNNDNFSFIYSLIYQIIKLFSESFSYWFLDHNVHPVKTSYLLYHLLLVSISFFLSFVHIQSHLIWEVQYVFNFLYVLSFVNSFIHSF